MRTYLIAISILVMLGLWMASGLFTSQEKSVNKEASVDKLTKVRVQTLEAQIKQINIELRGRTEAKRIVDITAEISGKLIQTPVEKGEHVKQGDVLCQLAEEDRTVQLSRAEANLEKAQIDYDGSMKLYVDGMISSSVLANSRAQLETEKAAVKTAQLNIDYLHMRAPFDAYVEDRPAKVGALIERGAVCARLMDESLMLATGQLSEKQVHLAQVGQKAKVRLIDGRELDGHVTFIARTADPVTRTYRVEVQLEKRDEVVRAGITAQVTIPLQQLMAHHFSPAVLALDKNNQVSVRIINAQDKVEVMPIKVVDEDTGGIWVTGLTDTVRLIVVGQELVAKGQQVEAIAVGQ